MNAPLVIAGVTVAGGIVGLGSGWLAVALEKFEKLEDEERQERLEYERDVAEELSRAAAAGEEPVAARPWSGERYGWTWLERWLSPALGAIGFGAFAAHEHVRNRACSSTCCGSRSSCTSSTSTSSTASSSTSSPTRPSSPRSCSASGRRGSPSPARSSERSGVAAFFFVQNLVSRGSIGLGDAKLGALVGAVTGAGPTSASLGAVYAVIAGVFIGGATAIVLLVTRIRTLKDPIPYGPFLCAGAALILYLGP